MQSLALCSPAGQWDEIEKHKVAAMRRIVEAQDQSAKHCDDYTLRRFLRARNRDVEKGSEFFLKHLKWRKTLIPEGFISESQIANDISQKKAFLQGFDKRGRPIAVFLVGRHYPSKCKVEETKRFIVYAMEKLCSRMQGSVEKFSLIGDFEGWGFTNIDIRLYMAAIDILQSNYPERLEKVYLVHAPYLFMKTWKILYPFIDDNTKNKFIFVKDKDMRATLLEEIDENQLPEKYGGKLRLVPLEEAT